MKHRHMVLWGVSLLVISCAAVEPARVEKGLYINPAYQFSLRVPAGWGTSKELPALLKKEMSFLARQKYKVMFSDQKTKCFILVFAEKTEADWRSFKLFCHEFIASLNEYFAKEKNKVLKKPGTKYYRYEIYQDQIENCEGHCIVTRIAFQVRHTKATGHNICYESNLGLLYSVSLILGAPEGRYTTALTIFKTVVDSFQHR